MKIFALGDPHLSLATPGKGMEKFGEHWRDHHLKLAEHCVERIGVNDLLLIPGDLSWAMKLPQAQKDLDFLGRLPGRKVIIRGNHDYWWASLSKVNQALSEDMIALQANATWVDGVCIGGTRLWDVPGVQLGELFPPPDPKQAAISAPPTESKDAGRPAEERARADKIYRRELGRIDLAIQAMQKLAAEQGEPTQRIFMIHYPPCDPNLTGNEVTQRFEEAEIDHVVFGHLHNLRTDLPRELFGERNGVHYHLVSCDFLRFRPKQIW